MSFAWEPAPRLFLLVGLALLLLAVVLRASDAALLLLGFGITFLLVALAMAYERPGP